MAEDFDGRGRTFTADELRSVLDAADRNFGIARFDGARFVGEADFWGVHFESGSFDGAQFDGNTNFAGARFAERADFAGATFTAVAWFSYIEAMWLNLEGARFTGRVEIWVRADEVEGRQVRFDDTALLRVEDGRINLPDAVFSAPSSVSGGELRSLRGCIAGSLTLTDVDLRWCEFTGAHRLDQLRIEGRCPLNSPPRSWRWTRRAVLAEEYYMRWDSNPPVLFGVDHARLAAVYRSLRKSFEDSKNEAGAGDFYYGEMEMRRRSGETRRAEKWILWLYWLISGYGQRAGRALAALLVLVATVAMLLTLWGQPADEAAQIAVGAVVLRNEGKDLTDAGEWTVMVARFLGPVLLALVVLAVRARVKR